MSRQVRVAGKKKKVATQSKNWKPHNMGTHGAAPVWGHRPASFLEKEDRSVLWEAGEASDWQLSVMAASTPICTQEEWSLLVLVSSVCLVLRSIQLLPCAGLLTFRMGAPFSYCPTRQTSPKTPPQTQPESVSYWFAKHSWTQSNWQSQLTTPPYQQPCSTDAFASGLWGLAKLWHGRILHSQSRTL